METWSWVEHLRRRLRCIFLSLHSLPLIPLMCNFEPTRLQSKCIYIRVCMYTYIYVHDVCMYWSFSHIWVAISNSVACSPVHSLNPLNSTNVQVWAYWTSVNVYIYVYMCMCWSFSHIWGAISNSIAYMWLCTQK